MIRHLISEYGYLRLRTRWGTLNVLAILVSASDSFRSVRVWRDRSRFGQLIRTASSLRRKLAAIATIVVTPILFLMLVKNGASLPYTVVLIALVLIGLSIQLTLGVLSVVPRLLSDVRRIQTIDFVGAVLRLVLLVALMGLFLNSVVAVAVGAATLFVQYLMMRHYAVRTVDLDGPENEEDRQSCSVSFEVGECDLLLFPRPNTIF